VRAIEFALFGPCYVCFSILGRHHVQKLELYAQLTQSVRDGRAFGSRVKKKVLSCFPFHDYQLLEHEIKYTNLKKGSISKHLDTLLQPIHCESTNYGTKSRYFLRPTHLFLKVPQISILKESCNMVTGISSSADASMKFLKNLDKYDFANTIS
jgi:hypothetical protein